MKKYIEVKENSAKVTHLKIELYYDLGGMNYFTGRAENRGYYLSVTPVERGMRDGGAGNKKKVQRRNPKPKSWQPMQWIT